MPTTMMEDLKTNASIYADNVMTIAYPFSQYLSSGSAISNPSQMEQPQRGLGCVPHVVPPLTTSSLLAMRQQMDANNHDMVNMFVQQIGIVFNLLIQNTNHTYQQFAHQMGRIFILFVAPKALIQPAPQIKAIGEIKNPGVVNNAGFLNNQVQQRVIPKIVKGELGRNDLEVVLVNRNQDAYQVVRGIKQTILGDKIT